MRKELSILKRQLIRESDFIRHPLKFTRRLNKRVNAKRQIYIDCGANTGQVLTSFIEKNKNLECHIFEPQPELEKPLKDLIRKHRDVSIHYYKKAVWTKDEKLEFYLATEWEVNHKGGSTLLNNHTNNLSKIDYNSPVQVDAIDFTNWLQHQLQPSQDDYIILKMDIEGAEYEVLEKMIASGSMSYISELIVEFHHQMIEDITENRHDALIRNLKGYGSLKLVTWH